MTEDRPMPTAVARATGACLVVYSYLGGLWLDRHGQRFDPVDEVREWLNRPLGLGEDFGVLGLMLLLLASGYSAVSRFAAAPDDNDPEAATSVQEARRASGFDLARLVRIAVPLGVGAALAAVFRLLDADVLLRPLAWVIGIELVVWLSGVLAVRVAAWTVPLVQLLAVASVLLADGISPQLAVAVVLYPLAVLGQVFGDRRLPSWAAWLFGLAVWALLAWTEHVYPPVAPWWYPLTALIAVLFFLAALRADDTVGVRPAIRWLAGRARWLLVLTGGLGWAVLGLGLPFPLGFALALAAIAVGAEIPRRVRPTRTSEVPT
jgi:hypothetical protein